MFWYYICSHEKLCDRNLFDYFLDYRQIYKRKYYSYEKNL